MKRFVVVAAILALAFAGAARADETCEATTLVFVEINPNICVQALMPSVDMGSVQTGEIFGYIPFQIDANTEQVLICVAATPLAKGFDFESDDVPLIPVDLDFGVNVDAEHANPTGGQDNNLEYTDDVQIEGIPASGTECVEFESSQNCHFSQNVLLTLAWLQENNEQAMGEYTGLVQLTATVVLY